MLNKIASLLTADNIKAIFTVGVKLTETLKKQTTDWKKKSILSIVISVIAVILMMAFLIYFILTHRIAPLMIYTACMVPILAFGLAQYSRNMVKLANEYEEYRTAIRNLLMKIKEVAGTTEDDATMAMSAIIRTIQQQDGLNVDDETTISEIEELPEYPAACKNAILMQAIGMSLQVLKEEGLDVSELLAEFDIESLEYANDLSNSNMLDSSSTN